MNFLHYLRLKGKDSQRKTGHARSDTQARALIPSKRREPGNSALPFGSLGTVSFAEAGSGGK